jgi:hypothetical protein
MRNRLITAVMATLALATFYYATSHQRIQPVGLWSVASQVWYQPDVSWL